MKTDEDVGMIFSEAGVVCESVRDVHLRVNFEILDSFRGEQKEDVTKKRHRERDYKDGYF